MKIFAFKQMLEALHIVGKFFFYSFFEGAKKCSWRTDCAAWVFLIFKETHIN